MFISGVLEILVQERSISFLLSTFLLKPPGYDKILLFADHYWGEKKLDYTNNVPLVKVIVSQLTTLTNVPVREKRRV